MKTRLLYIFFTLLVLLSGVRAVYAQGPREEEVQTQLLDAEAEEASTRISRREASELARDAFEGRVLSVRLEDGHWRIRMDQEGNVFNVLVDANTGRVTRSSD
jgi:uncharacterized membrane protein YkoI